MTEPKRPGLDEAIEAAARELASHEPIAGGMWCYCQPTDDDGRGPSLAGSWEAHLAASVVPIIAAAVRADERAKVLAALEAAVAENDAFTGQAAGVRYARACVVRALTEPTP